MRTRVSQWSVLAMSILATAGCHQSESVPAEVNNAPAQQTSVHPAPPPQPLIFYDETGDPSEITPALSELEVQEIIDSVADWSSDSIWLIRVRPTYGQKIWPNGQKVKPDVVAYLVPEETAPRVRVGRACDIRRPLGKARLAPGKYIQVSVADRDFTEQLTKPSVTEMPFDLGAVVVVDPNSKNTSAMSREELIRIVDFMRQPSSYQEPTRQKETGRPSASWGSDIQQFILTRAKPYELPILSIRRTGDTITVGLGFQHDSLAGHGWTFTVKRMASEYQIVKVYGPWTL
jgi:hypothetical protein